MWINRDDRELFGWVAGEVSDLGFSMQWRWRASFLGGESIVPASRELGPLIRWRWNQQ